jgi:hypothetical protein
MHTLTSIDVLDLNNPTAPAAYSVDGVHAKAAITNEPRHHDLSHWIPSPVGHDKARRFDWTSVLFNLRGARARVTILRRRCDRLVTIGPTLRRSIGICSLFLRVASSTALSGKRRHAACQGNAAAT